MDDVSTESMLFSVVVNRSDDSISYSINRLMQTILLEDVDSFLYSSLPVWVLGLTDLAGGSLR